MLAKDLISDTIPSLRTSDTGLRALSWMDIFRISHLPIVNNKDFLGLISDKDIYDLNMADEPIGNHKLSLFSPYVTDNQHIYEVIEIAARLKLTVVPVLDEHKNYLGLITVNDLILHFTTLTAANQPGAIIVLELNMNDYSLTEISQIVESNDAKILSLYVSSVPDSTRIEVTLKINRNELSSIIQTFNRYDYTIKASFMEDTDMESLYNNRFEMFMRYLDV
ncbi:MAG TPA: CBS domain-containing protein [Bacteroidales bacterium]|nr:CBS domain-containing protein [Bacteroidales bacterium]